VTVTAELSSRTTAACTDCAWTSEPLTDDLSVRVAARQHTDLTQHPVAVLTNTITMLQPGPATADRCAAVGHGVARIGTTVGTC
jgi:hypothetical protein